jgi:oligopeptide transport system ATP-binding protein
VKKLLEVKNLQVFFGVQQKRVHAVRNISFFLREGERLGIVGESGCGKSATAKALVKLLPSYSSSLKGEVWFDGKDLMSYDEKMMRRIRGKEIGMIFQDPMTSLNPTMRVGARSLKDIDTTIQNLPSKRLNRTPARCSNLSELHSLMRLQSPTRTP